MKIEKVARKAEHVKNGCFGGSWTPPKHRPKNGHFEICFARRQGVSEKSQNGPLKKWGQLRDQTHDSD